MAWLSAGAALLLPAPAVTNPAPGQSESSKSADNRSVICPSRLAVRPEEVVPADPADGRVAAEGAVWSAVIVEVDPGGERGGAFLAGAIDASVGPAVEQRADETLGLAI